MHEMDIFSRAANIQSHFCHECLLWPPVFVTVLWSEICRCWRAWPRLWERHLFCSLSREGCAAAVWAYAGATLWLRGVNNLKWQAWLSEETGLEGRLSAWLYQLFIGPSVCVVCLGVHSNMLRDGRGISPRGFNCLVPWLIAFRSAPYCMLNSFPRQQAIRLQQQGVGWVMAWRVCVQMRGVCVSLYISACLENVVKIVLSVVSFRAPLWWQVLLAVECLVARAICSKWLCICQPYACSQPAQSLYMQD